jgi:hypothetical protein
MPSYLNGVEILGTPKTVRLEGTFRGVTHAAPLEVWVAAIVAALTPEQKTQMFEFLARAMVQREITRDVTARVVADIPLPTIGG